MAASSSIVTRTEVGNVMCRSLTKMLPKRRIVPVTPVPPIPRSCPRPSAESDGATPVPPMPRSSPGKPCATARAAHAMPIPSSITPTARRVTPGGRTSSPLMRASLRRARERPRLADLGRHAGNGLCVGAKTLTKHHSRAPRSLGSVGWRLGLRRRHLLRIDVNAEIPAPAASGIGFASAVGLSVGRAQGLHGELS